MGDTKSGLPHVPVDIIEQPTLRVMRLYKPRLDARRVVPSCSFNNKIAPMTSRGEGDFALSSSLKLPDSFGNIYLGETFTAYVSVLNQLPTTTLLNTCLSAKLQSPSNRVDLDDKRMMRGAGSPRPNPAPILRPSENLDMIVEHTLQELGMHTLRVTVQFELAGAPVGSEPRSMRKFYRFSVMNPVDMFSVCTSIKGNPLVELQLRNTTQMDLLLESCEFVPENGVVASVLGGGVRALPDKVNTRIPWSQSKQMGKVADLDGSGGIPGKPGSRWCTEGGGVGKGMGGDRSPVNHATAVERYDERVLLCPDESYQLTYAIKALVSDAGSEGREFEEGSHTLGQVELHWRTTMGETGSIRSAPVIFEAPDRPEVEVTVDGLPDVLQLGRVADCVATVRNRSGRPMTLQLQFRTDGMVGVYVHGQSFRNLGEIAPGTSVQCSLQLLALVAGLHELRGCTVADMHTAQEFPQGKLRDVLVEFPQEGEGEEFVDAGRVGNE